jgi:hypothetical protein
MLKGTDAYAKAALFGFGIYSTAALIILVAILIFSPSDAAFGIILLVPATIAVLAVRFIRRWGLIIGALLSAFGIFFFIGDAALVLSSPQAFLDFLLDLFGLTGVIISLIACLVGTVQYFRGAVPEEMAPSAKTALRGIAGVITVLVLVSLVLTIINANETVSAADRGDAPELVAKDTKWSAQQLTTSGKPARLFVKNDDPILHTFTVKDSAKGIDIDVHIGPWSEQVIELAGLAPGTYGFICRVEGHEQDMTGVVTVR